METFTLDQLRNKSILRLQYFRRKVIGLMYELRKNGNQDSNEYKELKKFINDLNTAIREKVNE